MLLGDFVGATTWFLPHVITVDSTEFIAVQNGMFLAANMGCNSIEIESDCSFAVNSVQLMDEYLGPNVTVIIECKQMRRSFEDLLICTLAVKLIKLLMS